ncbi:hypothetical protein P7C70_g6504, partial [Phenoliferia sp. Uapishka_3]
MPPAPYRNANNARGGRNPSRPPARISNSGLSPRSSIGSSLAPDGVAGTTNTTALLGTFNPDAMDGEFDRLFRQIQNNDEFKFSSTAEIYTFVNGLLGSTVETATRDFQDTQAVLSELAKTPGNAISRFGDVLTWPRVEIDVGASSRMLSFQHGIVPIFLYLSSKSVRNSTARHHVNALYAVVHANVDGWLPSTLQSIKSLVERRTLADSSPNASIWKPTSFLHIFSPILQTLCEWVSFLSWRIRTTGDSSDVARRYLSRFDKATVEHPSLINFISELDQLFTTYSSDVLSSSPSFEDSLVVEHNLPTRHFVVEGVRKLLQRLGDMVQRVERQPLSATSRTVSIGSSTVTEGTMARLESSYELPGELRAEGPRHDNDKANIRDIILLPTHDELVCEIRPSLPSNIPSAPHHLPVGSMERQLDIFFRLLREDNFAPIRAAIQSLLFDLTDQVGNRRNELVEFLKAKGGRWKTPDTSNQVNLDLYGGVEFKSVAIEQQELVVEIAFFASAGPGKQASVSKKLSEGNLVGLLLPSRLQNDHKVYLGKVSQGGSILDPDGGSKNRQVMKVAFDDPNAFQAVIDHRSSRTRSSTGLQTILFEVPNIIPATITPFLAQLQTAEPSSIPFANVIARTTEAGLHLTDLDPPRYARNPAFRFNLTSLLRPESAHSSLSLDVNDSTSVSRAKVVLAETSELDHSQADALIHCLQNEVAMVEGPPGTGKSWVGVKLVRTLLQNNISPIMVVCYTNHALDQFLEHLLSDVTSKIIRCGSSSKSEKLQEHTLYEQSRRPENASRLEVRRELYQEHTSRKKLEAELEVVCSAASAVASGRLQFKDISSLLESTYPDHFRALSTPPSALVKSYQDFQEGGWHLPGVLNSKAPQQAPFIWWRDCLDFTFLHSLKKKQSPPAPTPQHIEHPNKYALLVNSSSDQSDRSELPNKMTTADTSPWKEPSSNRPLPELLSASVNVWELSRPERRKLQDHWATMHLRTQLPRFASLRKAHKRVLDRISDLHDQAKLATLKRAEVIGCTTNGAANILGLLGAALPRVLIVEEAGECLESHVLVNLVPSLEHLILIGDHLQLRPKITCNDLSVESKDGKNYRLDVSLFERLVKLRGMSRSVIFFTHDHAEDNQASDSTSRTNTFEAQMAVDLVLHFINQGYRNFGDIVILVGYLGQIPLVRSFLAKMNITVELDDRDSDLLDGEEAAHLSRNSALKTRSADSVILIRTVDNFQGEEAKVVILSLVRNRKTGEEARTTHQSIGFLKSPNRANVALSRAQHGLIILGNAPMLRANSAMWSSVVATIEDQGGLVNALPIRCELHPASIYNVRNPGELRRRSPSGKTSTVMPDACPTDFLKGGCLLPTFLLAAHNHVPRGFPAAIPVLRLVLLPMASAPCLSRKSGCRACTSPKTFSVPSQEIPARSNAALSSNRVYDVDTSPLTPAVPTRCRWSAASSVAPSSRAAMPPAPRNARNARHPDLPLHWVIVSPTSTTLVESRFTVVIFASARVQLMLRRAIADLAQRAAAENASTENASMSAGLRAVEAATRIATGVVLIKDAVRMRVACPVLAFPVTLFVIELSVVVILALRSVANRATIKSVHSAPRAKLRKPSLICLNAFLSRRLPIQSSLSHADMLSQSKAWTLPPGWLEIGLYYSKNTAGEWDGLLFPPQAPSKKDCPNCRSVISAHDVRRYGRVLKAQSLETQEQLAITRGSYGLSSISSGIAALDLDALRATAAKFASRTQANATTSPLRSSSANFCASALKSDDSPVKVDAFSDLCFHDLESCGRDWKASTSSILQLYQDAVSIADARSPHVITYDASYNKLYREELDRVSQLGGAVDEAAAHIAAARCAREQIGAPPPRTESRVRVEAIWVTLTLRLYLADLASTFAANLPSTASTLRPSFETFHHFILETGVKDAEKCIEISSSSESLRQEVESHMFKSRFDLDVARTEAQTEKRRNTGRKPTIILINSRISELKARRASSFGALDAAVHRLRNSCHGNGARMAEVDEWLEQKVWLQHSQMEKEWKSLVDYVRDAPTYREVTLEEKKAIIEAMKTTATHWRSGGTWYHCPNGHAFNIGDVCTPLNFLRRSNLALIPTHTSAAKQIRRVPAPNVVPDSEGMASTARGWLMAIGRVPSRTIHKLTPPRPPDRFERSLPSLPVPTLSETASRYLKSIQPFHTPQSPGSSSTPLPTFAASESAVAEFLSSPLVKELQERLEKRASEKSSWLSEWWNEAAYFGWRGPVVP